MDIRELGPADDPGVLLDLSVRAFGPVARPDRTRWQEIAEAAIGARQYLGVFDGGQLLAAARYHDMVQWWHGQPVPMAGVASVAVAPEERGRGTGRALMRALLGLIGERGYQISVLYPATLALYRSLGWEIAGGLSHMTIPARSLRSLVAPDASLAPSAPGTSAPGTPAALPAVPYTRMRRCGPRDATDVLATIGRVHQALRECGPNTRDEAAVARWLSDEQRFAYLAPDGFLAYRWQHGNDELLVERVIASSAAATRAIWGIVASHSSIAGTVRATVGPADPVQWLTTDPDVSQTGRTPWMLRVVDAAAAVAGRGFPPGVELTAALRLADPDRPAHDGWWTLDVGGSKGVLTPAEPGLGDPPLAPAALTLGPRGFAALYGGTPLATLRRAGLAAGGDPGGDAALDAAFGADPFMLEFF
ncbi:MAG: GNAT family N-acetyltransferase [Streptosporangiaceae bacterium]